MYEFAVTPAVTQLRRPGVTITEVAGGSVGEELELTPGDRIVKVNGQSVRDYLDFRFQTAGETDLTFQVRKFKGETLEIEFDRDEGEDLGLMFEQIVPRQCANECIFCFCKGNPDDARPSLFVRDEDIRLSFLYGNYTTLSSITDDEMKRIVEQRLSPQYVSVHATDPEVRRYLLGRKRADDVLAKMRYLADHGIELHAQIVLCPTINDGEVLRRTIADLEEFYPALHSVAVVPVVFTQLHNYRHLMTAVTNDYARQVIGDMRPLQREARRRFGTTFVFLADEFYLRAGLGVPGRAHYGDYPQIEDGVGMVRRFRIEAEKTLKRDLTADLRLEPGRLHGTVATGELFYPILEGFVSRLNKQAGTRLTVVAVKNRFFGEEVTVAGLIAGSDLLACRDQFEGDFLIVPEQACLKGGRIFLDDLSLEELEQRLEISVTHGGASLASLIERARKTLIR